VAKALFVQADARELPQADDSVHCCVTSPPYWGLRDYGHAGQIGLEPTLAEYLAVMVGVFREVRRVLRPDGTLWLNMGDGYSGSGNLEGASDRAHCLSARQILAHPKLTGTGSAKRTGLKPKDLMMQPHRLAIALQDDGWYVRMDNVWAKPNPMPESVTDRPTKSHEYVFLLSKSERYYYDAEAVRERARNDRTDNVAFGPRPPKGYPGHINDRRRASGVVADNSGGRNLRSVWTMTTRPCKEAHFATFPIDLPLRCIKAGTSERGCCPTCGGPWKRIVERTAMVLERSERTHEFGRTRTSGNMVSPPTSKTITWLPTCKCPAHEPVPCTVLDPFGGAATTALAAHELGRHCVIVERKAEYIDIGRTRLANHRPRTTRVRRVKVARPHPMLWEVPA
jgi:DNA modification methylase